MKIVSTFAVVEESLYSVRYDGEDTHELARLFRLWNDAEYLESFFTQHQKDLTRDFWQNMPIEESILKTKNDAKKLQRKLHQIALTGKNSSYETLSTLFKPLHDNPDYLDPFEKSKTYGMMRPSWLRIYAIRIETNVFVISGGAIKLTKRMDRPHLQVELEKLDITQNFCRDNYDLDFDYFEIG